MWARVGHAGSEGVLDPGLGSELQRGHDGGRFPRTPILRSRIRSRISLSLRGCNSPFGGASKGLRRGLLNSFVTQIIRIVVALDPRLHEAVIPTDLQL